MIVDIFADDQSYQLSTANFKNSCLQTGFLTFPDLSQCQFRSIHHSYLHIYIQLVWSLGIWSHWRLTSYIAQNRTRSYLVQKSRGEKVRCLYSVLEVSASCLRPASCTHNSQVTCLFGSLLLISGVIFFSSFFLRGIFLPVLCRKIVLTPCISAAKKLCSSIFPLKKSHRRKEGKGKFTFLYVLCVCVSAPCARTVCRSQKRALDPWDWSCR